MLHILGSVSQPCLHYGLNGTCGTKRLLALDIHQRITFKATRINWRLFSQRMVSPTMQSEQYKFPSTKRLVMSLSSFCCYFLFHLNVLLDKMSQSAQFLPIIRSQTFLSQNIYTSLLIVFQRNSKRTDKLLLRISSCALVFILLIIESMEDISKAVLPLWRIGL
jgi:hypothetical protein